MVWNCNGLAENKFGDKDFQKELGKIFIAGDFNCRVGVKADYIQYDNVVNDLDPDEYIPDTPHNP
ncbi:hypothetical protein ACF0H5_000662 [Mactra antiquata]